VEYQKEVVHGFYQGIRMESRMENGNVQKLMEQIHKSFHQATAWGEGSA
jgi:hypothetical protein